MSPSVAEVSVGDTQVTPAEDLPEYSVHLDAIRGTAACTVFFVHLHSFFVESHSNSPSAPLKATVLASGSDPLLAGSSPHRDFAHKSVMVFFVLSGFLVGGSVLKAVKQGRWSWKTYLLRRIVRLWMVLLPALALGFFLDAAGSHHFAGQATIYSGSGDQDLASFHIADRLRPGSYLGNVVFLQGILVSPLGSNQPLWSLANEFWYYLAFPLIVLAFWGQVPPWKRLLAGIAMTAILVFVGWQIALYFIIWLMGAGVALLPQKIPATLARPFAAVALLFFAGVGLSIFYREREKFPVDLLIASSFVVLLYCILHLRRPFRDGLYRRASKFFSRISYSLYLTHAPVMFLMNAVLVGTWRLLPLNGSTAFLLAKVVAMVFLVACGIHFLFETHTDQVRRYLQAKLAFA